MTAHPLRHRMLARNQRIDHSVPGIIPPYTLDEVREELVNELQDELHLQLNIKHRQIKDIEALVRNRQKRADLINSNLLTPAERQKLGEEYAEYDRKQREAELVAKEALAAEAMARDAWDHVR